MIRIVRKFSWKEFFILVRFFFYGNWVFSTGFGKKNLISNLIKPLPVGLELLHAVGHDEANSLFSQIYKRAQIPIS